MTLIPFLLLACTPLTRYRQSILVPAAEPPLGFGAPLRDGEVALGASFSGNLERQEVIPGLEATVPQEVLDTWFPQPGDPGLWVSPITLDAHARLGIGGVMDLGATFHYADGNWANRSSIGVMDIPGHPPLWGAGAFATVGKSPDPWGLGFTLEATLYSTPWARYTYTGPAAWDWALGDGEEFYVLEETGTCNPILVRGSLAAAWRWKILDLGFGGALSPQITNNGFFDDDTVPAWEPGPFSAMPVLDLGVTTHNVHVGATGWWAFATLEPTNGLVLGPGGRLVVSYRGD